MQYKIITVNLPHGGSTAPADTARQVEHLRAENRILWRLHRHTAGSADPVRLADAYDPRNLRRVESVLRVPRRRS